jgi:hypothetical protein
MEGGKTEMKRRHLFRLLAGFGLYGAVALMASALGGLAYFHFGNPQQTCAACHEMTAVHSDWSASAHSSVHCRNCHGGSLTLDVHAIEAHLNRVVQHFAKTPDRTIHLRPTQVLDLHQACRNCHPQAFADWQASRHATTLARIFLDPEHNRSEPPSNDCLRCHGMFAEGDIAELVAPTSAGGSWAFKDPAMADQPVIPCLACHQIHARNGESQTANFYDRRERSHISADRLPVAAIADGDRPVKVSRDARQRVCTQCHAPAANGQLGSSDDRTPAGVHEGLSCRDCHWTHRQSAKASCTACHPADSHCGLDVRSMDTTYFSPTSKHNIHTVACRDCHPAGR